MGQSNSSKATYRCARMEWAFKICNILTTAITLAIKRTFGEEHAPLEEARAVCANADVM